MYKKIMSKFTNGKKPSWLTLLLALTAVLVFIINWDKVVNIFVNKTTNSILLAQAVETNTEEIIEVNENVDSLKKQMEQRDKRFDKFLMQQTVKNALDSVKTETIIEILQEQKIFNGKVTEHIIKSGNE